MRAVYYEAFGAPDLLRIGDRPEPEPDATHVLIRNHAAGIGFWDVKQLNGLFGTNMPMPVVPGFEAAGVIEHAPEGSPFSRGDAVFATPPFPGGACAEFVRARVDRTAPAPRSIDAAGAAALVVSATTAYEGIVDRGEVSDTTAVLITAASGSVGTAAVQIAVVRGARVFAVAGPASADLLRSLGAELVLDYHDGSWPATVREASGGIDVVFDAAGGDTARLALSTARPEARLLTIVSGLEPPPHGPELQFFSAVPTATRLEAVAALVDAGRLRPIIAETLPLADARTAFERIAGRHPGGKVVLTIG
ncbi:MAG: NADP-dependent oxidoreductase [Candidatus Dormibacteraeota bacterium]|nr:NADP-dependent oxidoreductase [Candidatus Dormibacteraeota bacterium]